MRILVVDNDHNTVETLKAVITTKTAYQVDVAYDGKDGLNKMRSETHYDLLILDIMMPEMSGIDVCNVMTLDERKKKIPILLVSALPISSREFQASLMKYKELKLNMDVLEKPFKVDDLIAKINLNSLANQHTP